MPRRDRSSKSYRFLLLTFLSIGATVLYYETIGKEKTLKISKEVSRAENMEGLYVFIHSRPQVPYYSLGMLDAKKILMDTKGTEHRSDTISGAESLQLFKNLTLSERLNVMITATKKKYIQADGVIFKGNLNSCEVIKFVEE